MTKIIVSLVIFCLVNTVYASAGQNPSPGSSAASSADKLSKEHKQKSQQAKMDWYKCFRTYGGSNCGGLDTWLKALDDCAGQSFSISNCIESGCIYFREEDRYHWQEKIEKKKGKEYLNQLFDVCNINPDSQPYDGDHLSSNLQHSSKRSSVR